MRYFDMYEVEIRMLDNPALNTKYTIFNKHRPGWVYRKME